jgi:hypothetical protein
MVAVLARSDEAGMFIQDKGKLGLESQASAFEDDLWTEF